ncbi:MAG: hypothetical protein DRP09_04045 [Candidatus Thorarchaeota archaeon]|nr:MAG: hypothetical protein DRP09_04045 [Candidatus Thorarchaeota archaeon]
MNSVVEDGLKRTTTRATDLLRELGFGAHEAAVIVALTALGSATVSGISAETGIHHANLYTVLDALSHRGLVVSQEGRPRVYRIPSLSHMEEMLIAKVRQLREDLEELHKTRHERREIPTLIYTVRGEVDVVAKIVGLIERAVETLLVVAPSLDALGERVLQSIAEATKRGVRIRAILAEPTSFDTAGMEQRIKRDTMAIDMVADSKEALISMPDLSVCGWADNPFISVQLEGFLEQTWQNSKKE